MSAPLAIALALVVIVGCGVLGARVAWVASHDRVVQGRRPGEPIDAITRRLYAFLVLGMIGGGLIGSIVLRLLGLPSPLTF